MHRYEITLRTKNEQGQRRQHVAEAIHNTGVDAAVAVIKALKITSLNLSVSIKPMGEVK